MSAATDQSLILDLAARVGEAHVQTGEAAQDYTHDVTFLQHDLSAAVHPATTEEVAAVVRLCAERDLPIVARGAGTSLVGGPVPLAGGVVVCLDRLDQLELDVANTVAVAGAGVITARIDGLANEQGLMYPPDPASISMSTIGGNVACNSGGMRCVKYGVTADYVVGLTVVLASGEILRLGGRLRKRSSGYRLQQLFIGSEGTLGIVTEVIVKLIPNPRYRATAMVGFRSLEGAGAAVSRVLGGGHFPTALEIMDRYAIDAVHAVLQPPFAPDIQAVLVIEQDGHDFEQVQTALFGMVELLDGADNRIAQSDAERERLWHARRNFGKLLMEMPYNRLSEDVAVPIGSIPEMLRRIARLAQESGIRICTVGHAGDGNLHPSLLFTDEQRPLISAVAGRIFRDALELGGTISAEHGLGVLKRDYAQLEHSPLAMSLMRQLKDLLDPRGLLNPHKVFPEHPADDEFLNHIPGWFPEHGPLVHRGEIAT
ncbi:MAG: FAD-binding protein [Candidatus Dormibacteraeota bacterium]|uniref:FAD-binding protein n=1 Tax=Candidatus Dormiibacter inghamiae TaxID=3127013 RepID=A0A934NAP3_9BACT|nr:FAD-binding protein [Candidatus Dormibacteraeota bacterium]MBJ7606835.1 FAD-binding protein [Candidatus Dormibacteraeota bacterium]